MSQSGGREREPSVPSGIRRWARVGGSIAALAGVATAYTVRNVDAEGRMLVVLVAVPVVVWIVAVGPLLYAIRREQRAAPSEAPVDPALEGPRRTTYRLMWGYVAACLAVIPLVLFASQYEPGERVCGPGPVFADYERCVTTERLEFGAGPALAVLAILVLTAYQRSILLMLFESRNGFCFKRFLSCTCQARAAPARLTPWARRRLCLSLPRRGCST